MTITRASLSPVVSRPDCSNVARTEVKPGTQVSRSKSRPATYMVRHRYSCRVAQARTKGFFYSNLIPGYNCTIRAGCGHGQQNPAYEKGKRPLAWGKLRPFQGRTKIRHFGACISNCFNIRFVCRKGLLACSKYIECHRTPVLCGIHYMNAFFICVQKNGEFLTSSESGTIRSVGVTVQNYSHTQDDAENAGGRDSSWDKAAVSTIKTDVVS